VVLPVSRVAAPVPLITDLVSQRRTNRCILLTAHSIIINLIRCGIASSMCARPL